MEERHAHALRMGEKKRVRLLPHTWLQTFEMLETIVMHPTVAWNHYMHWRWRRQSGVQFYCHLPKDTQCNH